MTPSKILSLGKAQINLALLSTYSYLWPVNRIVMKNQTPSSYSYGEPTVEPKGQRFLFGGKEREHAGGRNAYDFGARSLTPFGSWPSPDPKAEDFYQISPFSYCAGDPINFIDPTGNRRWPVSDGPSIQNLQHSNDFGKVRKGSDHPHGGVDINYRGDEGGPVYATHDGIVSRIVDKVDGNGGGLRLKITSYDGHVSTFYMHMEKITEGINLGDAIVEGQEIGKIGSTGRSKGAHVHYEISIDGKRVNPAIDRNTLIDAQLLNKNHLNEIMVMGIHIVRLENLIDLKEYLNKEIDKYIESIKPKMILEVLHY